MADAPLTEEKRSCEQIADAIVSCIICDLSDRSGLQNAWDEIDDATKDEIRKEWRTQALHEMGVYEDE